MNRSTMMQFVIPIFALNCCHGQQKSIRISAQKTDCNKGVFSKSDKKGIPKEVCIPQSYVIYYVLSRYDDIDFNQDGYLDYVFTITKRSQSVGDSTYIVLNSSYGLNYLKGALIRLQWWSRDITF